MFEDLSDYLPDIFGVFFIFALLIFSDRHNCTPSVIAWFISFVPITVIVGFADWHILIVVVAGIVSLGVIEFVFSFIPSPLPGLCGVNLEFAWTLLICCFLSFFVYRVHDIRTWLWST